MLGAPRLLSSRTGVSCFLFRFLARHMSMDLVSKGSNGTLAILLGPIFARIGLSSEFGGQCPPRKRYRDISWLLFTEGPPTNNHMSPTSPSYSAQTATHSPHVETRHFLVSSELPGPEEGSPGNYNVPLLAVAGIVVLWLFIFVLVVWNYSDYAKPALHDASGTDVDPTADLDEWLIRPLFDDDDNSTEEEVARGMTNGDAEDLEGRKSVMPGACNNDQKFWANLNATQVPTIASNPPHESTPYETKSGTQEHVPSTVPKENDSELLGPGTPCRPSTQPREKYEPVAKDENGAEGTPDNGHVGKSTSIFALETPSPSDPLSPLTQPHTDGSSSGSQIDDGSGCAPPNKRYEHTSVLGRQTPLLDATVSPLRRARLSDDHETIGGDTFWADQVDARLSGRQDIYQAPRRSKHRCSSCDPFWYQGGQEDYANNWRERHPLDAGKASPIFDEAGEAEYLGTHTEEGSIRERRYLTPPLKFDSPDAEWPDLSSNRANISADPLQERYVVPQKRAHMMRDHAWSAGCLCIPNPPVDEWWDSMTLLFQPVPGLEPIREIVKK
ncbi:hypothetical protein PAXRUDRAFT_36676 [Paxillus rubicundulus Ve08.2h10]|uniref:Uncharacterized protein n=1 Tax=Paxillus rubicundulus Ve08.2h10 TaxID=930991 RepID=A0A0D0DJB0_9AGAM|nr:hypothetical protein PAXRUDRAFT_36676 [Paxillus rubicundulus Ve08.2h10]